MWSCKGRRMNVTLTAVLRDLKAEAPKVCYRLLHLRTTLPTKTPVRSVLDALSRSVSKYRSHIWVPPRAATPQTPEKCKNDPWMVSDKNECVASMFQALGFQRSQQPAGSKPAPPSSWLNKVLVDPLLAFARRSKKGVEWKFGIWVSQERVDQVQVELKKSLQEQGLDGSVQVSADVKCTFS